MMAQTIVGRKMYTKTPNTRFLLDDIDGKLNLYSFVY